jgi:hypothetical protein
MPERSLDLLVPGLFWPDPSEARAYEGLALPALGRLLGKGAVTTLDTHGLEGWLAARWGGDSSQAPVAQRMAGRAGLPGQSGHWLCADPVNLEARGAELFLTDGRLLDITRAEAEALVDALGRFFAEDGLRFVLRTPERWLLHADEPPALETTPLSAAHGRPIDALLPKGDHSLRWMRRLNEAQMLLHGHPVNAAREDAGQPLVNSLWLWGGGDSPISETAPYAVVYTDDDTVAALAVRVQVEAAPETLETALRSATRAPTLLHVTVCEHAARTADLGAWRGALDELDRRYVAPALGALSAGIVDAVRLVGITGRRGVEVELSRLAGLRFWRRAVALDTVDPARLSP